MVEMFALTTQLCCNAQQDLSLDLVHSWNSITHAYLLQDLLICIEMLFFAITHYFVFSHKPFINPEAAQIPCIASCIRMLDVRDVYGDVREHFVDPIPLPKLSHLRKNHSSSSSNSLKGQNSSDAEMLPLLKGRGTSPLRDRGSAGNDAVREECDDGREVQESGDTVDETTV